jgi:histidyl-tRNA synthetase
VFDQSLWLASNALAAELRRAGLNVMIYPEPAKLQKQFKFADRMKMKVAVTIGPDEAANGQVAVKNLLNGEQVIVPRAAAAEKIRELLKNA